MLMETPKEELTKRHMLLEAVESIGGVLRDNANKSEEISTLASESVEALKGAGMLRLKVPKDIGGFEVDPVTDAMVLEALAYHDMTSAWCTMVGNTTVSALAVFLKQPIVDRIFKDGIPTGAVSFFPAGRAKREKGGYRVSGHWRFGSAIRHAEWVAAGTIIENEPGQEGPPQVIFAVFPIKDVKLHDNWGDVVGLKGTGSCDFSVENYFLPDDMGFVWDLLKPQPLRGGDSYRQPPFIYVSKEHGSVVLGAARRSLDELIKLATTTRGMFRSSGLADRQVVQRFVGESDLKLRAARALMHETYAEMWANLNAGILPDEAAIAACRSSALYATDIAIHVVTQVYHFGGNSALHQPHVIERNWRDVNTAGLHQMVSDTSYENHGRAKLGMPITPLA